MSERAPEHNRPRRTWRGGLRALLGDSDGATAIEYGLIVSLIVITMIAALQGLANTTVGMWNTINAKVQAH